MASGFGCMMIGPAGSGKVGNLLNYLKTFTLQIPIVDSMPCATRNRRYQ